MGNRDEFDEEGFIDSLLTRRGKALTSFPKARLLAALSAAVLVAVLILIISVVSSGGDKRDEAEVPVIRAEGGDYKVAPEDRGGMAVPNKDSTVFENLKGSQGGEGGQVENILEDPEQPVKKEEVFTEKPAPVASPDAETKSDIIPAPDAKAEKAPPAEEQQQQADQKPEPAPEEKTPTKPAVAAVKPVVKKEAAGAGSTYLQLGAVKTEVDAKAQWPKLQKLHPSLAGLSLRIQKADTPKGVFYRIQAGPLAESSAREVCAALNAKKAGGCLVKR